MFTAPDFSKKQIVFVLFNEGEKMAFSNDNLVVKDANGKIKFQCTCYRLFLVFAVGHTVMTSVILQKAQKFGFFIAMMTPGFRLYALLGAEKNGHTLLHRKQYGYTGVGIARAIVKNKIENQVWELKRVRNKNDSVKDAIVRINAYIQNLSKTENLQEMMAYEGLASKLYFKNHFNNVEWKGRQPRLKRDYVNAALDIGYTLLFTFMDALLSSFGFDTYCGVMHREFYMRKSLVCDMVEPFRPLIDRAVKKAINLKQIKAEDFMVLKGQYRLKWDESARYISFLMQPLMDNKESIFVYVQSYYRAFLKGLSETHFPVYSTGEDV